MVNILVEITVTYIRTFRRPARARNVFKGNIAGITDLGSIVKLTVDARKKFLVQITKRSLIGMNLSVNSKVFLTFGASSVYLV